MTQTDATTGLFCPRCDYDLRAMTGSGRCPECGLELSEQDLIATRLPWVHRRRIGIVRAYLRTVRLACAHPQQLAAEAKRGIRLNDALAFRRITVVLAATPVCTGLAALAILLWRARPELIGEGTLSQVNFICEVACLVTVLVAAVLLLTGVAGAASYFFHPRSLTVLEQNGAIAISYYLCAPMFAIFVGGWSILIGALLLTVWPLSQPAMAVYALGFVMCCIALLWQWVITPICLRAATRATRRRTVICAILLPTCWMIIVIACAIIPAATAFISLFVLNVM